MEAATFSTIELLRDGKAIEVRSLRPTDRAGLLAALDRSSAESRYRRFFAPKRGFTEDEIAYYLNIDFVTHVALVAAKDSDGGAIIGGARYIVVRPGQAEVALFVADDCQGQGIGTALMRHLAAIGRDAGLQEMTAEVLADNMPMMRLFEKSGMPLTTTRNGNVIHVILRLL
jgi:GNAT superfamily N-acetyltransferase